MIRRGRFVFRVEQTGKVKRGVGVVVVIVLAAAHNTAAAAAALVVVAVVVCNTK